MTTFCAWGRNRSWGIYFGNCNFGIRMPQDGLSSVVRTETDSRETRGTSRHFSKECGVLAARLVATPGPLEEDLRTRHGSLVRRQNDSVRQALSSTILLRTAQTSISQAKKDAKSCQIRLLARWSVSNELRDTHAHSCKYLAGSHNCSHNLP